MTPETLVELRRAAMAATPGPWCVGVSVDPTWDWPVFRLKELKDPRNYIEIEANAKFIEAASPATILELLDEVDRYRIALEKIYIDQDPRHAANDPLGIGAVSRSYKIADEALATRTPSGEGGEK